MFGFNKKKRAIVGPVSFEASVEIDRPSATVFPLIDITDTRFGHAQRGAKVVPVNGSEDSWVLTIEEMGDVEFRFRVLERVQGARVKLEAAMVPQITALVQSVEDYVVEPTGEEACRVTLITEASFDDDLTDDEVANEIAVMSAAVHDDLLKLKVHAEEGLEAAKALDDEDVFDLDLDEINFDKIEFGEHE